MSYSVTSAQIKDRGVSITNKVLKIKDKNIRSVVSRLTDTVLFCTGDEYKKTEYKTKCIKKSVKKIIARTHVKEKNWVCAVTLACSMWRGVVWGHELVGRH